MESDGDSLLSSNFFSSSSPLCQGKDVAQISVGLNICSASVEVQEECEIKLVSVACAVFFIYKLVLNGTYTGICICGPINAPDDYYIK